jgi:glycosyltransferase involved in cell wall biosynthesis
MRILYCNKYNFPFSGTEVYLFELMEMMRQRGHEVALFSMADSRGIPSHYDDYLVPSVDFKSDLGVVSKVRLASQAIYSREARRRIRRMIAEFRPDVAHVRNIYHHLTPSILWELKRRGVPVLYHVNDFKLLCPNYNFVAAGKTCERCRGGRFWRAIAEGCYSGGRAKATVLAAEAYVHRGLQTYQKCVDQVLAPSHFVRQKLSEYGWPEDRIGVLPHFQKVAEPMPRPAIGNAPIVYFGRLSPEKGVEDILLAMEGLADVRLIIAGDGPLRPDLEKLAATLRPGQITFTGHLEAPELESVIASSRFTVFPSRAYETLGKSILESYAQGRAVVASNLGSRPEFVKHGQTGLLYPAGNVEQLASIIAFLHERPQYAAEMGEGARSYVHRHHSPESHAAAITEIYEKLVGQRPRLNHTGSTRSLTSAATPRLRVAFIGGRGVIGKYSGIEGYYEEVGRRLAASGHEVTVYCRNYFTPRQPQHNGMRLVYLPTIRSKHLDTFLHTLLSTAHVMFRSCDIVHYHTLGPALFSFFPRLAGKKTAVTVQGLDWQRKKWGRIASAVLRLGERAAVRLPDTTMVVSRTLQSHFREGYGAETHYIPNGAGLREPSQPERLLSWGIEKGRYVLFLGRFSPEKNCHLLVDAFERIDSSVKLVLAGGPTSGNAYVKELQRHACYRVRLLDYVSGDDFEALLSNAMLFVLPSDLEGLSLALLEAMGAGLCVLTSDVPENCELVDGAGFTFKRGDSKDLEHMLRILIAAPQLRQAAGSAARLRIDEQYRWAAISKSIEEIYFQILGTRNNASGGSLTEIGPAPKKVA